MLNKCPLGGDKMWHSKHFLATDVVRNTQGQQIWVTFQDFKMCVSGRQPVSEAHHRFINTQKDLCQFHISATTRSGFLVLKTKN